MDKRKLENLLKRQEGPKLDFKQSLDINTDTGKKELVKDVCAIANSQGGRGYIVIGVEDKTKNIIGINSEDVVEEQIQQVVSSRCDPPIPISVEKMKYNGKNLAIIAIYYGEQKPYQVRDNGAFYIRRGSTTDIMRKDELVSSFENNMNLNSELCSIIKSSPEVLDMELINKYFKYTGIELNDENKYALMESTSIINRDRDTNEYCVTLGGLLVFSKINNIFLPQNVIRIVNRINKAVGEVFIVKGELLEMLDEVEEKLYDILPQSYPTYALLEGVKNAVLYRDYTIFSREIEIIINYNSVVLCSPGVLIRGKSIQSPNYVKRNMWIYEKLITIDQKKRFNHGGTGFTKIKRAFKKYGKVLFINSPAGNTFKIVYPGIKNIKNNINN
ncbi:helix-turn-helix domain-containing protein [Haloimpatiens massiliensis]|uniref:AlbA family DNA-binding domain-containing protein n=1 Tax=Haloimpatiens massiliensis TaxID=1658110 RepID=UPI000C83A446|nr:RNA-binding domain-containing protein [Haloimpatiens massiliensis]